MSRIAMIAAATALALAAGAAEAQQAPSVSDPQQMPAWRHGDGPAMRMMMGPGMMGHGMMGPGIRGPHMMLVMMALVDTDGSETLSLDEVQAVHARLFRYADTDSNGELTLDEMRAFMSGDAVPQQ